MNNTRKILGEIKISKQNVKNCMLLLIVLALAGAGVECA